MRNVYTEMKKQHITKLSVLKNYIIFKLHINFYTDLIRVEKRIKKAVKV